jgi:hypothetical protein
MKFGDDFRRRSEMVGGDTLLWLGLGIEIVSVMNWRKAIC